MQSLIINLPIPIPLTNKKKTPIQTKVKKSLLLQAFQQGAHLCSQLMKLTNITMCNKILPTISPDCENAHLNWLTNEQKDRWMDG